MYTHNVATNTASKKSLTDVWIKATLIRRSVGGPAAEAGSLPLFLCKKETFFLMPLTPHNAIANFQQKN